MAIKFNRSSINQRFALALLFLLLVGQAGLNSAATPEKANYGWLPAGRRPGWPGWSLTCRSNRAG